MPSRVRYSGVAHFDHLIWPTWVVILCIGSPFTPFGLCKFFALLVRHEELHHYYQIEELGWRAYRKELP